jgi:NAD(P)H-dependent FMN reductase
LEHIMSAPIRVLGISGSLRKGTYNIAALRAAQELAPAGMQIETADISQIPHFNEDLREQSLPPAVEKLAEQVVEVLPEWRPRSGIVHAVFPSRRGLLPAVRALIDFLAAEFALLINADRGYGAPSAAL